MILRVKVISDLHIGIPDTKSNDFHISDDEMIAYLDRERRQFDMVILNGDVWELWESGTQSALERFNLLATSHQKLFLYIRTHIGDPTDLKKYTKHKNLYYINGNHDWASLKYNTLLFGGRVARKIVLDFPGEMIVCFSHGHECDACNSSPTSIGRAITWCVGQMECCVHEDVDEVLGGLVTDEFVNYAERAFNIHTAADVIIFGHTHKAGLYRDVHTDRIYANCGCARGPETIDEVVVEADTDSKILDISVRETKISTGVYTLKHSDFLTFKTSNSN